MTRAGRLPACSWPACGLKDIHATSPRLGTYGRCVTTTRAPRGDQNQLPHECCPWSPWPTASEGLFFLYGPAGQQAPPPKRKVGLQSLPAPWHPQPMALEFARPSCFPTCSPSCASSSSNVSTKKIRLGGDGVKFLWRCAHRAARATVTGVNQRGHGATEKAVIASK